MGRARARKGLSKKSQETYNQQTNLKSSKDWVSALSNPTPNSPAVKIINDLVIEEIVEEVLQEENKELGNKKEEEKKDIQQAQFHAADVSLLVEKLIRIQTEEINREEKQRLEQSLMRYLIAKDLERERAILDRMMPAKQDDWERFREMQKEKDLEQLLKSIEDREASIQKLKEELENLEEQQEEIEEMEKEYEKEWVVFMTGYEEELTREFTGYELKGPDGQIIVLTHEDAAAMAAEMAATVSPLTFMKIAKHDADFNEDSPFNSAETTGAHYGVLNAFKLLSSAEKKFGRELTPIEKLNMLKENKSQVNKTSVPHTKSPEASVPQTQSPDKSNNFNTKIAQGKKRIAESIKQYNEEAFSDDVIADQQLQKSAMHKELLSRFKNKEVQPAAEGWGTKASNDEDMTEAKESKKDKTSIFAHGIEIKTMGDECKNTMQLVKETIEVKEQVQSLAKEEYEKMSGAEYTSPGAGASAGSK